MVPDIESKRARVDRREARVLAGCGRPRHRRLVNDTDFGLRHAVETLQIVGGLAADGDDPPGGGRAPARGEFQVEALHGSMGAGEIAIANIMQRHDCRRQQHRRQEGHNVGRHKEHVRRAPADLPRQRPVGPQPVCPAAPERSRRVGRAGAGRRRAWLRRWALPERRDGRQDDRYAPPAYGR